MAWESISLKASQAGLFINYYLVPDSGKSTGILNFILLVELLVVSEVCVLPEIVDEPTVISGESVVLLPSLTDTTISKSICWTGTPVFEQNIFVAF